MCRISYTGKNLEEEKFFDGDENMETLFMI